MPEYVVTKKAFYNGAILRPGARVTLSKKPSWAEKPATAKKQQDAKEEAVKKQESNAFQEKDIPENPTVEL